MGGSYLAPELQHDTIICLKAQMAFKSSGLSVTGLGQNDVAYSSPVSADNGNAQFDDLYSKALLRKKLFKEYVARNQILEHLNQAIEALYDCDVLPEEPLDFIASYITAPPPPRPQQVTSSTRITPVLTMTNGGASPNAKRLTTTQE